LEGLRVHERIILKWIFKKQEEGVVWIDLAQERDRFRDVVNPVIEPLSSIIWASFLTS
jgi:hypothetical protein